MDASSSKMPAQTSLFQVYLRLRPTLQTQTNKLNEPEPWLIVEPPSPTTSSEGNTNNAAPTHITLQPPSDSRKRAVEKFCFTQVFEEEATQLDIFESTGTVQLVKNILNGGRDGLVATLGVTGSGKVNMKSSSSSRSLRGVEPHNPWISFATRPHANDARCAISFNRHSSSCCGSIDRLKFSLLNTILRSFRSSSLISNLIPRKYIWRRR